MDPVLTELHGDLVLELFHDEDPDSPRNWDNLGKMVCWHRRYNLGDKHGFAHSSDFIEESKRGRWEILPLFLYDHSGLTMSTDNSRYPFCDRWDAGQVGFIYVTPEDGRKEYGRIWRARARKLMGGEVEEYDQYLRGDVYGYVISREVTCDKCDHAEKEELDSCWGFYGHDDALGEARRAAQYQIEKFQKEEVVV